MKKKYGVMASLILLLLFISACGDVTIEVKSNGSGKFEAILPSAGMFFPVDGLEQEIKQGVADEEGISNIKIREKKNNILLSVDFDNISAVDNYAYEIPVSDLVILEDDILDQLILTDEAKEFDEASNGILMRLPSDLADFSSTTVILPGKVVAHSENIEIEKSNTVELTSSGAAYVVYEPSSNATSSFGIIFIIIIVVAGAFFVLRKKK